MAPMNDDIWDMTLTQQIELLVAQARLHTKQIIALQEEMRRLKVAINE